MQGSECSAQPELVTDEHQRFEGHDDIRYIAVRDACHQCMLQLVNVISGSDDTGSYSSTISVWKRCSHLKILLETSVVLALGDN